MLIFANDFLMASLQIFAYWLSGPDGDLPYFRGNIQAHVQGSAGFLQGIRRHGRGRKKGLRPDGGGTFS